MSIIIEFSKQEKQALIKTWNKAKRVGDGAEGICHQIDGYVYKVFNGDLDVYYNEDLYDEKLNLKSFLFPEEIYVSDNKVFASKTRYVEDKMSIKRVYAGILPDIDKIKNALPQLIKDIYVLSKNDILAIDIAWRNILFDGENLYAIDTMNYIRNEKRFKIDTYKWNISHLQMALIEFTSTYEKICQRKNIPLSKDKIKALHELPYYIKKVSKQVENEDKIVQKIKRP